MTQLRVIVGDGQEFIVDYQRVTERLQNLQGAVDPSKSPPELILRDVAPETFDFFHRWLKLGPVEGLEEVMALDEVNFQIDLYRFAKEYACDSFYAQIFKNLYDNICERRITITLEHLLKAFEELDQRSGLYMLLLESLDESTIKHYDDCGSSVKRVPTELFMDVLRHQADNEYFPDFEVYVDADAILQWSEWEGWYEKLKEQSVAGISDTLMDTSLG